MTAVLFRRAVIEKSFGRYDLDDLLDIIHKSRLLQLLTNALAMLVLPSIQYILVSESLFSNRICVMPTALTMHSWHGPIS